MATTPNYDIDPKDSRLVSVNNEQKQALTENEKLYQGMIDDSQGYYKAQIDASKKWAVQQQKLQNQQTDFAIKEIEQQKAQATKDYTKEQSGAYVDWQKQSNQYGANAEQMAAQGLANSGYSESSQVAMYNQYQNRVATARESFNVAIQNFNNAITEARLQNNSILAEIAYEAQKQQLELSLAGFQHKNQLVAEKANKTMELKSFYHTKYQDVIDQINTENALAEQVRQANMDEEFRRAQLKQQKEIADAQLAEEQRQFDRLHPVVTLPSSTGGGGGGGGSGKIVKGSNSKSPVKEVQLTGDASNKTAHGGGGRKFNQPTAYQYLNALIKEGASKDKVANAISLALRDKAISKAEAHLLRQRFTPRGIQY